MRKQVSTWFIPEDVKTWLMEHHGGRPSKSWHEAEKIPAFENIYTLYFCWKVSSFETCLISATWLHVYLL